MDSEPIPMNFPVKQELLLPPVEQPKTSFLDRWLHLPILVGLGASIANTAWEYVKKNYPQAGLSTVPTVALIISFFALCYFVPKKRLIDAIDNAEKRSKELANTLFQAKQEDQKFDENLKTLAQLLQGENQFNEELKQDFKKKNVVLGQIIEGVKKMTQDTEQMEKIYREFEKQALILLENTKQIDKEGEIFENENDTLKGTIDKIENNNHDVIIDIENIDKENKKIDFQNNRLLDFLKQAIEEKEHFNQNYQKLLEQNKKLEETVEKFSKETVHFSALSKDRMEQLLMQHDNLEKLKELIEQMNQENTEDDD